MPSVSPSAYHNFEVLKDTNLYCGNDTIELQNTRENYNDLETSSLDEVLNQLACANYSSSATSPICQAFCSTVEPVSTPNCISFNKMSAEAAQDYISSPKTNSRRSVEFTSFSVRNSTSSAPTQCPSCLESINLNCCFCGCLLKPTALRH